MRSGDVEVLDAATGDHVGHLDKTEWQSFCVVRGMATQWNRGFSGTAMGLRYEALPVVAGSMDVPLDKAHMETIRLLEAKMIGHWAKRDKETTPPPPPPTTRRRR